MNNQVALEAKSMINGVKYGCGCVAGSDRKAMFMFFPPKCRVHKKPITGFWRK